MINKEKVTELIDEIGTEGFYIFGTRFWLYFMVAAAFYDGTKIDEKKIRSFAKVVEDEANELRSTNNDSK